MSGKRFNFAWIRLPFVLFSILFIAATWSFTAQAQVGTADYDTTYIPLQHTMSSAGDSLKRKLGTIMVAESSAGKLVNNPGDSVQIISSSGGFPFVKDSVVAIASSSTRSSGIQFDTAGAYAGANGLQPGSTPSSIRLKPGSNNGTGYYFSFMVKTSSTAPDTISIGGIYVQSVDTTNVLYDSTTSAVVLLSQIGVPGNTTSLSRFVALPGPANKIAFGPASRLPNARQTVGNVIDTVYGGSTTADTSMGIVITFLDQMDNLTSYGVFAPAVVALLTGTSTRGNGTLSGTSVTHWYSDHHVAISFDGLSYRKTEKIDLKFTFGSSSISTATTTLSGGITIAPGCAANISAAISGKDVYAVDETKKYNLMVTDEYFNPVNPTWVQAREVTSHGGVFTGTGIHGDSICTGTGASLGETSFTFDPSNYFVGRDTLLFVARSSNPAAQHFRNIQITPGDLGGIIVDYARTPNDTAITEMIAAGETVYVRAFLRDSYGNPIDATSTSSVTFSIGSVLGRNMALKQSGVMLTKTIEEPQYLNSSRTAIGVAIPYTVSTNVRTTKDTVIAMSENYALPAQIQNRSNVPAVLKMVQTTGSDSSVVASHYANSVTFTDTIWDAYGNLVEEPGTSITIPPTRSAYAVYFSAKGLVKFDRVPVHSDTTVVDTLYPSAGVVGRTVSSGEGAGIDTVKSWSAANPLVAKSTPVWVTPATYSQVALTPTENTTVMAGEVETLTIEKQDAYGNHIDWGLPGGNRRLTSGAITRPLATQITADSAALLADTVTTGHNRGGYTSKGPSGVGWKTVGKAGIASVPIPGESDTGTLNETFTYKVHIDGADTQKIYVKLTGGATTAYDTSLVISIATGSLRRFLVSIDTANALSRSAGDSVKITVTAQDSSSHRIYSYGLGDHALTLNGTAFSPITLKDTTHHFTYSDIRGKHVRATGAGIDDTVFNQGQAVFYLHKFAVDTIPNTVTISGNGHTDTSETCVMFCPLPVDSSYGYWTIEIADTSESIGAFTFTVIPRDKYHNVNTTEQVIVNIASNQLSGFDVGSNPKVVKGPTTFTGTSPSIAGGITIYVFDNTNSHIYCQLASGLIQSLPEGSHVPTRFALGQNYPNPFNPATVISFDLPKMTSVKIVVYDILGREVRTLVSQNMAPGRYTATWNGLNNCGEQASSGVYFYRMEAGGFISMKKMVLIK